MHGERFDVFLSHHGADDAVIERIAEQLRGEGLQPWLDRWCLSPGGNWQQEIAQGLRASKACAVLVGPQGLGAWARQELAVAQDRAAKDPGFRLFMVLLPGAPKPDDPNLDFLLTRTWVDLRTDIDDPDVFQDLVCAITGVSSRLPTVAAERHDDVCPYRGLEVFDEAHTEFFFGRADDTARIVEKLRDGRFLAVLGPSGCGKSSLVRAGVIPELKQGGVPGSTVWTIRVVTPGARPLSVLAAQLASLFPQESMQRTLDGLRADERSLDLAVSLALAQRPGDERLVLVVDQFEEAFTLCADEDERAAFLANLCYAGSIPGGRLVVLVAMRSDFYSRCAAYPELRALMAARQFLVGPLEPDALREVIEQPAWRAGLKLEAGLVETILANVADRPGTLPLLEYVLLEVWRHRRGRMLTLEAYRASGGVEGALAQRADAIFESLTPAQQQIARRVLLRLIQPGEGTEDTRRRAGVGELLTRPEEEADLEAVVNALADARLLITGQDELTDARVVDIAHEALIRGWPQLRSYIDEDRELLRAQRRLTEAATEWDREGREEGLLYRGARLAAWADRPTEDLNDLERAFLAASQEREARERAARRQRRRLIMIGLSTALVIISALAILALVQANQVANQLDLALSRELAANATERLSTDPELSILLAGEAFKVDRTPEAEAALRQAIVDSPVRVTLRGHEGAVRGVAFSPDGQQIASAGADGTVRIWNTTGTGDPVILDGHEGVVQGVAFSPDGQQIASAGEDRTVRIWDATDTSTPSIPRIHEGVVRGVAFSPDGQQIASASADGTVRIWNTTGTGDPVILDGHEGVVQGVAFSPDGQQIASAGADGTVQVWDATGAGTPSIPRIHVGPVNSVAFSPDGQRIASAGADGTVGVRVWDDATGADSLVYLRGHKGQVEDVAFSPDGQQIASASEDRTIRIWDAAGAGSPVVLHGPQGQVADVTFSPDGQQIASASADGTVQIWNTTGTGTPLVVLDRPQGQVEDVALSPDGQQIAVAGADGTVQIWNTTGTGDQVIRHGPQGQVADVTFSPDGQQIAVAGADGTVQIWNTTGTGTPLDVLRGHEGVVQGVAFSPDGQQIASASADSTVRIWDATGTGTPLAVLRGHEGVVRGVAFSPDGQQIASASADSTVRIWNTTGTGDPVILRGHEGVVRSVAFSPDGQQTIASASADGTVRIWECEVCGRPIEEVLALAELRSTRELTCEERATYLHEPPARDPSGDPQSCT